MEYLTLNLHHLESPKPILLNLHWSYFKWKVSSINISFFLSLFHFSFYEESIFDPSFKEISGLQEIERKIYSLWFRNPYIQHNQIWTNKILNWIVMLSSWAFLPCICSRAYIFEFYLDLIERRRIVRDGKFLSYL